MKKETKILGIILTITVALLFGGVFLLSKNSSKDIKGVNVSQIDYSKGQKIGSDSAKVKLVEFSDFQCPACAAVEPYLKKIESTYPNDVQVIYRHFLIHNFSKTAANLAESTGEQGKFWEMHDKLFQTQSQWSALSDPVPFFLNLAKELNLDTDKIKKAIDSDQFKAIIDEDMAEGKSLGVTYTPSFFLNGKKLTLQKFEDLDKLISEELQK